MRAGVIAGAAAVIGLTAGLGAPAGADTTGGATFPITGAVRSISVSSDGTVNCINLDGTPANGLALPNGKCVGSARITNTGNEAKINPSLTGFAATEPITQCFSTSCTGSAARTGYYLGSLPGRAQFAAGVFAGRLQYLGPGTSAIFDPNWFMKIPIPPGGIVGAAAFGQSMTEQVWIVGPSGAACSECIAPQLTSVTVQWEADPL